MIDKPGIYDIPMKAYLADPCPEPSLSASCVVTMLDQSPFHAHYEHPRLGDQKKDDSTTASKTGDVAHSILLKSEQARIAISPYPEFRSNEAKAWRDAAVEKGMMVIKQDNYDDAVNMAEAFHTMMPKFYKELGCEFPKEGFEKTIVAQVNGVWCRIRVDAHDQAVPVIWDYKTTGTEYSPEKWIKNQLFGLSYDMKIAFYQRVYEAALGVKPRFIIAAQEQNAPYDCYPVVVENNALAEEKVDWAFAKWKEARASGVWEGYTKRVVYAVAPPWEEADWLARKAREDIAADIAKREAA